jgi:hypothetical protein
MTEASIKQKALTVANAFLGTDHATLALLSHQELYFVLVHVVEQSEAYKQEVSDAAKEAAKIIENWVGSNNDDGERAAEFLQRFIIPKPKPKPDPLMEVAKSLGYFNTVAQHWAGDVRAALDALGFEIKEKAHE